MAVDHLFSERVPPHDLEAEHSVLGSCLIDRDAITQVQAILQPDDWYTGHHKEIWQAILRAHQEGAADLITVQAQLQRPLDGGDRTLLDAIGGLPYLTKLMQSTPTTANAGQYAQIVATKARLRNIQTAARKTVEACYDADSPVQVLGDLQKSLDKEGRRGTRKGLRPIAGRIGAYAKQRYEQRHLPNADWIPSKFPLLRERCPYLRREITLMAAPPNTGKTTLAINEALFLAQVGYHVAFFELEMGEEQIFDKLIGLSGRLKVKDIRMGLLREIDWLVYGEYGARLSKLETLSVNNETAETMSSIRWQCLRIKAEKGLDMVVIDFLDRVTESPEKGERYDQLLARIAGIAQGVARECNCHVMILAQVDVRVMDRPNPIPAMSDLSNSKTNLAAWPDNIITGIQPRRATGDGKVKPAIWHVMCSDKRWTNTLVLSVAKGRFSEGGALVPLYAELTTGYLGSLRRPWPWQKDCPEDQVGLWDKEADEAHLTAMQRFRADAIAADAQDEF